MRKNLQQITTEQLTEISTPKELIAHLCFWQTCTNGCPYIWVSRTRDFRSPNLQFLEDQLVAFSGHCERLHDHTRHEKIIAEDEDDD